MNRFGGISGETAETVLNLLQSFNTLHNNSGTSAWFLIPMQNLLSTLLTTVPLVKLEQAVSGNGFCGNNQVEYTKETV